MDVLPSKHWRALSIAIVSSVALAGMAGNAKAQTPAPGAVWVDTNGTFVGLALDGQTILLKIPSVGQLVLPVGVRVYPTQLGDPIRYKYLFNITHSGNPVMSYESADCSGQAYMPFPEETIGDTVATSQYFDSVSRWLVVGAYPTIDPVPHFNSQLVQGNGSPPLEGPGAYCQTVDVRQGGPVVPVTHVIDQQTLASPALLLQ